MPIRQAQAAGRRKRTLLASGEDEARAIASSVEPEGRKRLTGGTAGDGYSKADWRAAEKAMASGGTLVGEAQLRASAAIEAQRAAQELALGAEEPRRKKGGRLRTVLGSA
jgi:hypothetical protein